MKVTYTEEAVADIVQAITYLSERNLTAAANLDAKIAQCIERLADAGIRGSSLAPSLWCHRSELGRRRHSESTISGILTNC